MEVSSLAVFPSMLKTVVYEKKEEIIDNTFTVIKGTYSVCLRNGRINQYSKSSPFASIYAAVGA